jgi:hypothetical protein
MRRAAEASTGVDETGIRQNVLPGPATVATSRRPSALAASDEYRQELGSMDMISMLNILELIL